VIGTTVGSYRITNKVSIGGMGTVYKAEHTLIGKHAAVKVLHPELTTNKDIVNRFFNEAKATTRIKHPGIVEVFDFGYLPSGHAYLVMEFLEGMSLARRLKMRGRIGEGEAAMMLRSVCSALGAAHAKGIVHRDLKPDNIFLCPDPDSATGERPKLLDFGIAKLTDVGLAGSATKTGAVMGTPTYMSPEQCRGTGEVDLRADLYSLGCIFYELVTARPPFTNLGAGELIGAHLFMQPDPPSTFQPGLSSESEELILALLAKKPDERPQTTKQLAQRLTQIAQHQGWITQTAPNGITAESLHKLNSLDSSRHTDSPEAHDHTMPSDPGATTPSRPSGESVEIPVEVVTPEPAVSHPVSVTEQPTTLSLAASQSVVDVKKKSKRGVAMIGIAIFGLTAGLVFAVMTFGGDRDGKPAKKADPPKAEAAKAATPPAPEPPKPPPPEPPKPEPPKAEPPKAEPPPPEPEPAKPAIAEPAPPPAIPPTAVKSKPVQRPKPVTKPAKEKKPALPIETDIE
jgi:serine/threonine protein kinase